MLRPVLVVSVLVSQLSARCLALELKLDLDSPISLDDKRRPCGVLTCSVKTSDYMITDIEDIGHPVAKRPTSGVQTVSALFTLMIEEHTSGGDLGSDGSMMARVTRHEENVSFVTDYLVVQGEMRPDHASLRLEFYTLEHCQANFSCEAVDEHGLRIDRKQVFQVEGQQGSQVKDTRENATGDVKTTFVDESTERMTSRPKDWAPEATMHIIGLIDQLFLKITSIDDRVKEVAQLKEMLFLLKVKVSYLEGMAQEVTRTSIAIEAIEAEVSRMNEQISAIERINEKAESVEAIKDKMSGIECKLAALGLIQEPCAAFVGLGVEGTSVGANGTDEASVIKDELSEFSATVRKDIEQATGHLTARFMNCRDAPQRGTRARAELAQRLDHWRANISSASCDNFNQSLTALEHGLHDKVQDLVLAEQNSRVQYADLSKSVQRLSSSNPPKCKNGVRVAPLENYAPSVAAAASYEKRIGQVPLLCDTHFLGGDWIVLQRRFTGELDFYRGWKDYRRGFGSPDGEFWIGLDNMNLISSIDQFELRIDLMRGDEAAYAHYATFSVSSEYGKFMLHVDAYSGNAGDLLAENNGKRFSTHDFDSDGDRSQNCAERMAGAWWYSKTCGSSNLNGRWGVDGEKGVWWKNPFSDKSATFTEMKIRRVG